MYDSQDLHVSFDISLQKYLERDKATAEWTKYFKAKVEKKKIKTISYFQLYQTLLVFTNADN